jgi:NTE family protein
MRGYQQPTTALALSGGGFRSTLFQTGALWRINELGWLKRLDCISAVSGGAIAAAWLGLRFKHLDFNDHNVATNFAEEISAPLQEFCSRNIDAPAFLGRLLSGFNPTGNTLADRYRSHLFGRSTTMELPAKGERPLIMLLSTNLQTGGLVQISRDEITDSSIGTVATNDMLLATAVAASSSLPPYFSPVVIETDPGEWQLSDTTEFSSNMAMKTRLCLIDGGMYDNLGLAAVWDSYEMVLASDASSPIPPWSWVTGNWLVHVLRANRILTDQARVMRRRLLIQHKYGQLDDPQPGAYWSIDTDIDRYSLADTMTRDSDATHALTRLRTRLSPFSKEEQSKLINWGYAMADAAMRRWVVQPGTPPGDWPFPDHAF